MDIDSVYFRSGTGIGIGTGARNGQIWLPFDRLHHYYSDIHEYSTINELKSDQGTGTLHFCLAHRTRRSY